MMIIKIGSCMAKPKKSAVARKGPRELISKNGS